PLFLLLRPPPPTPPPFPYTTLFRSPLAQALALDHVYIRERDRAGHGMSPERETVVEDRLAVQEGLGYAVVGDHRIAEPFLHGKRSEEHTSELQSLAYLVCRLLLEKK